MNFAELLYDGLYMTNDVKPSNVKAVIINSESMFIMIASLLVKRN